MKKVKQFALGLMCGVLIAGSLPVMAQVGKRAIDVVYNNIKLEVNGVKAKMPSGVEPFIYNGTTYLPVRAVAEALGENVEYDKNTATVYVGDKDVKPSDGSIKMSDYVKKVKPLKMWDKTYFGDTIGEHTYITNRGDKHGFNSAFGRGNLDEATADILLKQEFKTLKGEFIPNGEKDAVSGFSILNLDIYNTKDYDEWDDDIVLAEAYDYVTKNELYGDYGRHYMNVTTTHGGKVYTAGIRNTTKPIQFEIDVVGVDSIKLNVQNGVLNNLVLVPLE